MNAKERQHLQQHMIHQVSHVSGCIQLKEHFEANTQVQQLSVSSARSPNWHQQSGRPGGANVGSMGNNGRYTGFIKAGSEQVYFHHLLLSHHHMLAVYFHLKLS
jgi:hypothetical protein